MSYTIVKDDEFYARQNENRLNVVVRHCRIGKVKPDREAQIEFVTVQ